VPLTSIAERADGSQDRAAGDEDGLIPCAAETSFPIHILFKKMRMALYRILPFIPFPRPLGKSGALPRANSGATLRLRPTGEALRSMSRGTRKLR
jgi:hypothetical protein